VASHQGFRGAIVAFWAPQPGGTAIGTNNYCESLGIDRPRLEVVKDRPDANWYSLLLVALLERGEPITLEDAAKRFQAAGIAPADRALASLKRYEAGRSEPKGGERGSSQAALIPGHPPNPANAPGAPPASHVGGNHCSQLHSALRHQNK